MNKMNTENCDKMINYLVETYHLTRDFVLNMYNLFKDWIEVEKACRIERQKINKFFYGDDCDIERSYMNPWQFI